MNGSSQIECDECHMTFISVQNLISHYKIEHNQSTSLSDNDCKSNIDNMEYETVKYLVKDVNKDNDDYFQGMAHKGHSRKFIGAYK